MQIKIFLQSLGENKTKTSLTHSNNEKLKTKDKN